MVQPPPISILNGKEVLASEYAMLAARRRDAAAPLPAPREADAEPRAAGWKATSYEKVNVAEIVAWCMSALGDEGITRAAAPNSAAWALYQWAAKNPNEFWSAYAARLLPTRQQVDKTDRFSDSGSGVDKLVDMLAEGLDADARGGF